MVVKKEIVWRESSSLEKTFFKSNNMFNTKIVYSQYEFLCFNS